MSGFSANQRTSAMIIFSKIRLNIFLFQRFRQEKQVGQHFVSWSHFYFWKILCWYIECVLQAI